MTGKGPSEADLKRYVASGLAESLFEDKRERHRTRAVMSFTEKLKVLDRLLALSRELPILVAKEPGGANAATDASSRVQRVTDVHLLTDEES